MLVDKYGRSITYLRISVTDRCNYRCIYCMPPQGVVLKRYDEILRYEEIEQIVRAGAELGINKIRLTGGEPLVKKNITFLVERIAAIAGIREVSMTTNGSLLTTDLAHDLKRAGMTRVNISLDTLDEKKFAAITRGGRIADVFQGIFAARKAGLDPIKINMVIFADTTGEEIDGLQDFCRKHGFILQTIKHFSLYDRKDPAGALSADRPPRCKDCNRLRITADGFIKPCLFSGDEVRIDLASIKKSFRQAVLLKPEIGLSCRNRTMCQIGG